MQEIVARILQRGKTDREVAPKINLLAMIERGQQRIGMVFTANTAYYKALSWKYPIVGKLLGPKTDRFI